MRRLRRTRYTVLLVGAICLTICDTTAAQRGWGWHGRTDDALPKRLEFPADQFTFCRIRYTSYGEHPDYNVRGRWSIDYPESEQHFSWRLTELTTVNVERDQRGEFKHAVLTLTDEDLFDYPFIYMLEVGELVFTDEEAKALREYLLRGGFLMVDDFWGEREWVNWQIQFARVLNPNTYPMQPLPLTHPVFNCVFQLDEYPQVPSAWHWMRTGGSTSERGSDSAEARYLGVHDQDGRLMTIVCHNTDLGDGWEREGENEAYFREISAKKAYPMGINIVVYALTH